MSLGGIALATDFAIVIVTAAILAILARKTKQPTIIAYILTGIVIGPVMFGIVTEDELIEIMAELGLGFLLFLLGIEMSFDRIRSILRSIVNISIGQTILQTALAFGVAFALGFREMDVIIIALATVFGATPIIVKILDENDQLETLPGRIDIGVLIVQDIYLVIVLALVGAGLSGPPTELALDVARVLGLMALLGVAAYLSYQYFLPSLLKRAATNNRVLFAVGIAWAFVFIFVGESFGLGPEVGGFLAGLSLAQLPYSTELGERMSPVTDFFLVVFFASIGLQLTAENLLAYWQEAVIASVVMMVGNFLIMFYLIDREQFTPETSFLGSLNMTQVSEFSLVVGTLAVTQELIGEDILGYLGLMALLTMTFSTYVIINNQRIYELSEPYLSRFESEKKEDMDLGGHEDHAVIVGYDQLVRESLDAVRQEFNEIVVVDRAPENVEALRDAEVEYIYGDLRHDEIREQADVENAAFVLSMVTEAEVNRQLLEEVNENATAFVAADHPEDAAILYDQGAEYVIIRHVLAGEMLATHITDYLTDQEAFDATVNRAREQLSGGEHDGR
jgi:Kef-type K+ transport system membrane component KefB/DNA-binding NarL/FixJ family response regulator